MAGRCGLGILGRVCQVSRLYVAKNLLGLYWKQLDAFNLEFGVWWALELMVSACYEDVNSFVTICRGPLPRWHNSMLSSLSLLLPWVRPPGWCHLQHRWWCFQWLPTSIWPLPLKDFCIPVAMEAQSPNSISCHLPWPIDKSPPECLSDVGSPRTSSASSFLIALMNSMPSRSSQGTWWVGESSSLM